MNLRPKPWCCGKQMLWHKGLRDYFCRICKRIGKPPKSVKGTCRICGCTEGKPCNNLRTGRVCGWADRTLTLCDNPQCLVAAEETKKTIRFLEEPHK